jgi:PAS domain S-box-containing protein
MHVVKTVLAPLEERYRLLLDAVETIKDYAIFMLNNQGEVLTWNAGARRIKGYEASEIIGQHFSKFYPAHEVDAGKCEFELEEASITGRFEDEGWRVRKDGTMFWANVIITAISDKNGVLVGFSKVTRDLTERRQAEEKLRRANESLEKRVEARTMELQIAKEDLESALAVRDDFLSVASHEIKTPLTSLRLQTQMLALKLEALEKEGTPTEKLLKTTTTIVKQVDRLNVLVDYMLDVSRARLGKFTFDLERVSASELVQGVLQQWREPLLVAECKIEADIQKDIFVKADAYRFEQVLANILSNAIKYAPSSTIRVSLQRVEDSALLSIHDSGPGIPAAKQAVIFERYERAENSRGVSGFGLGLFIARSIVDAHNGTIEVQSKEGEGTTFLIRIPAEARPHPSNEASLT